MKSGQLKNRHPNFSQNIGIFRGRDWQWENVLYFCPWNFLISISLGTIITILTWTYHSLSRRIMHSCCPLSPRIFSVRWIFHYQSKLIAHLCCAGFSNKIIAMCLCICVTNQLKASRNCNNIIIMIVICLIYLCSFFLVMHSVTIGTCDLFFWRL